SPATSPPFCPSPGTTESGPSALPSAFRSPADAGPPDAGPPHAGPPDAGPPDAGPPDAGPPDAGPPDAGPPDAGPPTVIFSDNFNRTSGLGSNWLVVSGSWHTSATTPRAESDLDGSRPEERRVGEEWSRRASQCRYN